MLLALIAGLVRPDWGTITLGPDVLTDTERRIHLPSSARRVGLLFQDGRLWPHRTALDNIALATRSTDVRSSRTVALGLLERVGIAAVAGARPNQLSNGQRQRLALARALAGDPRVMLLDDPLAGLSNESRVEMAALVGVVAAERGVPTIVATQQPAEFEHCCANTVTLVHRPDAAGVVTEARLA